MLPDWQLPCWPSVAHVKIGFSSGVQPPSMQTRPGAHVPPGPHGATQCSSTQTLPPVHCVELVHGPGLFVQTPFATSHA